MSDELKPCPHCGSTSIQNKHEFDMVWTECQKCKSVAATCASWEMASKSWNSRPLEDAQAEEIKKLNSDWQKKWMAAVDSRDEPMKEVFALRAENERLREVNNSTYCAYCNASYERTDDALAQVRDHIKVCEFHPMRKLETEIAELTSTLAIYADSTNWTLHMAAASSHVDPRPAEWDGPGYGPQLAKEALDTFVGAA